MKTCESRIAVRQRAEEVLRALLSEVSTIRLKEISYRLPDERSKTRFVAHVEVLGRPHALACEVRTSGLPVNLRNALEELRRVAAQFPDAAPVLIAPSLSLEAQAICKECGAGFLDLAGNARISVGEVFIGKRTLMQRSFDQHSVFIETAQNQPAVSAVDMVLGSLPRVDRHSRSARESAAAVAVA